MSKTYSVTSAGKSAAEDRSHRERAYFIAMAIRMLCVALLLFFHDWWHIILLGAGAVLLPYFAVVIANTVTSREGERPDAPETLELEGRTTQVEGAPEAPPAPLIVVDADISRRAASAQTPRARRADPSAPEAGAPTADGVPPAPEAERGEA